MSGQDRIPESVPGHWTTAGGAEMAERYADLTRADLTKGGLSDLELASRSDLDLNVWQTAAKERIRWLSVQLALARAGDPA